MAAGRKYFSLESQAHRDGYVGVDVDGETMKGDEVWRSEGFRGAPEVLGTGFGIGEVWGRLKAAGLVSLVSRFVYYGGDRDGKWKSWSC